MDKKKIAEAALQEYQDGVAEDSSADDEIRRLKTMYRQKYINKDELNVGLAQLFATGRISKSRYQSARATR